MNDFLSKVLGMFTSRRFWAAFADLVLIHMGEQYGLSPEMIALYSVPIVGWIIGDSINKTDRVNVSFQKGSNQ